MQTLVNPFPGSSKTTVDSTRMGHIYTVYTRVVAASRFSIIITSFVDILECYWPERKNEI